MAKGRSFDVNVMGSGKAVSQKPAPAEICQTKVRGRIFSKK
jgi:hypothetical protein